MRADVAESMRWSSALFAGQVWPIISGEIGGGELILMEGRPDTHLALMLDARAGIDGWQLIQNGGIRGIASRVQKSERVWRSFTVRYRLPSAAPTEYQKRKHAIESDDGQIYPHFTVHAYAKTETGPITAVAVCRTKDLISAIDAGLAVERMCSGTTFKAIFWDCMSKAGYEVKIWEPDATPPPFHQLALAF